MEDLLGGYDLAIDAHSMSIVESSDPSAWNVFPLSATDAYYSSGFWITSSPGLLAEWDRLVEPVFLKGNLWENDAFVAADLPEPRSHIARYAVTSGTRAGSHVLADRRGAGSSAVSQGLPIQVLHANWFQAPRPTAGVSWIVQSSPPLQDHYEADFEACQAEWKALGFPQPSST